jgi:hypothetical protein
LDLNRSTLQQLSGERIEDARVLLAAQRWSGAYYLAGYALECALKSCVVAYLERNIEVFFEISGFQNACWTHDIEILVKHAGLKDERDQLAGTNPKIAQSWTIAKDWKEVSRYEVKSQLEAEKLFHAINDSTDGVLQWVANYW